jgi:hypothetical protein
MSEVNEGVGIILARMESHPEEFFGLGETNSKWRWIFSENLRDVMTEPEKAALHTGMTKVRRLEITHRAIGAIIPHEEEETFSDRMRLDSSGSLGIGASSHMWGGAVPKSEGRRIK